MNGERPAALTNRRIGRWQWALSAEEGVTALAFATARRDRRSLDRGIAQRYAAMLIKQKKLLARLPAHAAARQAVWWT